MPRAQKHGPLALVYASPGSAWNSPWHYPFVRSAAGLTVINTGSVSLSYDGDRRASYLLLDDLTPVIRRVEYDVEREIKALFDRGFPHNGWIAKILASASPQAP
ncbi:MAG TPA: hypothetical protein VHY84_01840 [Bryobacteraceae bacterium]|nr:hypothetical protein [Bryobacteraceae bacterium]